MPVLTEEQLMLRDSVRKWADDHAPVGALRQIRDSGNDLGFDAVTFAAVAEMGLAGIVIPEAYGGADFGYRSFGVVMEELGRTLVATPLIASSVAAASAIVLGGSEAQKEAWLPGIASGETIATLAVDSGSRHAPERIEIAARATGSGYTLAGKASFVLEGMAAGLLVVAAHLSGAPNDAEGIGLFLVPTDAAGVRRTRLEVFDSRGYADIGFDDVVIGADALLGGFEGGGGRALLDATLDRARAVLAAEALGLATQAFETTLDYMKTRVQFDRTIGSFQALQHRAAHMFGEIQMAKSVVDAALVAIDANAPDTAELVSAAKARANDLANLLTREMLQLHGGIAMTDDYDAGFYLKRARAIEATYGSSTYHRERYARLKGL